eukprot:m.142125 g.142125  ORF g.142125 m.142125 type:complete len:476 (+) comp38356_c0_seq3:932-2359(+)
MQLISESLTMILLVFSEVCVQSEAGWGEWMSIVPCTKTCGGGSEVKIRTCYPRSGKCQGNQHTLVKCNKQSCPTHGQWSKYSEWSWCDRSCGGGYRVRTRFCNNPRPSNGGRQCLGLAVENSTCSVYPCPVHGGWSNYSEWTPCDRSCGGGRRSRTRSCTAPPPKNGGNYCQSSHAQSGSCSTQPCPVHGKWSGYSEWSRCDRTCGGGRRSRNRSCTEPRHNGTDCQGLPVEVGSCSSHACPADGGWSEYGEWSLCDRSCGGGRRSRTRSCTNPHPKNGGKHCQGSPIQRGSCSTHFCPVHGGWSDYSHWSRCSRSCGTGYRARTRSCTVPRPSNGGKDCLGSRNQEDSCSTHPCPVDGGWSSWHYGACSKSCGRGTRTIWRLCNNPLARYGGRYCRGLSSFRQSCCHENCPFKEVSYSQSYSTVAYKQDVHRHTYGCGWLWKQRCTRRTWYSTSPHYRIRYRASYKLVQGETCN